MFKTRWVLGGEGGFVGDDPRLGGILVEAAEGDSGCFCFLPDVERADEIAIDGWVGGWSVYCMMLACDVLEVG